MPKNDSYNPDLKELVKAGVGQITGVEIGEKTLAEVMMAFEPNMAIISPTQPYIPKHSLLWGQLIWRIGLDVLRNTRFTSPFGRFIKQLEVGGDVMETFINLKDVIDRNTLSNSDLFTMFPDDIKASFHRINKEWVIPTDYREAEIRKVVQNWDTLTTYVGSIVSNLQNSFEYNFQKHVKQMLFDYYQSGAFSAYTVANPMSTPETSMLFIQMINNLIDDFMTEPSTRNSIYNNTTVAPTSPAITICNDTPLLVTFNQYMRGTELQNALNLNFGRTFLSGNDNQDFMRNLIVLNELDFPTTQVDVIPNFPGSPRAGTKPIAFVLDPQAFQMYTQFQLMLDFTNVVTMNIKQTFHTDLILSMSPYQKAAVVALA